MSDERLSDRVEEILELARSQVARTVNTAMVAGTDLHYLPTVAELQIELTHERMLLLTPSLDTGGTS